LKKHFNIIISYTPTFSKRFFPSGVPTNIHATPPLTISSPYKYHRHVDNYSHTLAFRFGFWTNVKGTANQELFRTRYVVSQ
jgi:hypothetical protein